MKRSRKAVKNEKRKKGKTKGKHLMIALVLFPEPGVLSAAKLKNRL